MDTALSHLGSLAGQNIFWACLVVYGATIFFGNLGSFAGLWIAFEGTLGPWGVWFVLVAMVAATLSGDAIWFAMGRFLRNTRLGGWLKRRIPNHEKFEEHIGRRGKRWMILGKFAYGTNFPVIFLIGWSRQTPFRRFLANALLAIAIWLPIILGVSYALYSGLAPLAAAVRTVKDLEVAFLVGVVLFLLVQYGAVRVVKGIFK